MDEVEVAGRKVIVGTHGTTRVYIVLDASAPYTAYIEVTSVTNAIANGVQPAHRVKSTDLPAVIPAKAVVFDHHGKLSHKYSASKQAFRWLKFRPEGKVIGEIVVEPPLDSDLVLATLQLIQGRPAPEPVVLGVDVEDRESPVGLWARIRDGEVELGAAIPVIQQVNEINRKYDGPWFEDGEEMMEPLIEALNKVNEVIEDVKDGEIDPEREAKRWVKEFEEWAEKQCRDQDIIEELEIAGYRVVFAEVPPTALYVARQADVAVSYGQGRVTVGVSPTTNMDDIDLRELFEYLNRKHKEGWGGRNDVGGSPKNVEIDRKEFESEVIPLIKRWLERELG